MPRTRKKAKEVIIKLEPTKDVFTTLWPFAHAQETVELQGIKDLRHLFSDEKARMLHIIKTRKPASIYALAKVLERDFKSVRQDAKLLEKFGLIKLVWEGKKRKKLRPIIAISELNILVKV